MADKKCWNPKMETLPLKELKALQLKKLRQLVKYCYENSKFYRKKFAESGLKPGDIKTLDDVQKLPFTMKDNLRENYPFGMVAAGLDEIVEIHASSGTTGNPTVAAYTRSDRDLWSELMARAIYSAGGRKGGVIQISYGYGLFTGGLGTHYGAEKVGMAIIPASGGMTKKQIKLMKDFGTNILACTPSYAVTLSEAMIEEGVDPRRDLKLKSGLFGAEPWSERMRKRIEEGLGIEAYDLYGLTELCGPGVSVECGYHHGLHIWTDHFLVEVINPDTLETLSPGEKGELVFTTLTNTGLPLLRYRTRDISILEVDKCACGRTHPRMMRVLGRSDDMLIIRGVNVFPSQIEYVLLQFPELASYYQIIVDRPAALDELKIRAELTEEASKYREQDVVQLKKRVEEELENVLSLRVPVEFVKPGEIPRSEGKAKRVLDLRKEKI